MMQNDTQALKQVERTIMNWSAENRANISLKSYTLEIDTWRKLMGIPCVSSMVEIGCGSGLFLVLAIAYGFAESGLGIDPNMEAHLAVQGENACALELRDELQLTDQIEFRKVSMKDLMNKSHGDQFNLLVFRKSLHHIHERS